MNNNCDDDLHGWWGLSYASWLTIPRVLMQEMSPEWRQKMYELLKEYDETYPNQPELGTRVQITENGKLIKTPSWLINYRHPQWKEINKLKSHAPVDNWQIPEEA